MHDLHQTLRRAYSTSSLNITSLVMLLHETQYTSVENLLLQNYTPMILVKEKPWDFFISVRVTKVALIIQITDVLRNDVFGSVKHFSNLRNR